jgi:RHS repeat-associated protein
VTDAAGAVLERYLYTAYGERQVLNADWTPKAGNQSTVDNRHGFQGGRHSIEHDLVHFRYRDLHVTLGRWNREDPLGYVDGGNVLQAFVGSPVMGLDPLGLSSAALPNIHEGAGGAGAGAGLGAAVAALVYLIFDESSCTLPTPLPATPITPVMPVSGKSSRPLSPDLSEIPVLPKWIHDERRIADVFGIPRPDIGDIIHEIKENCPRPGNPDIEVDDRTGDIRYRGEEEIIDNIKEYK